MGDRKKISLKVAKIGNGYAEAYMGGHSLFTAYNPTTEEKCAALAEMINTYNGDTEINAELLLAQSLARTAQSKVEAIEKHKAESAG